MPTTEEERYFEALITRPLVSNVRLKKAVKAALAEKPSKADAEYLEAVQRLLGTIVQKTTPFHVRLIQGVTVLVLGKVEKTDPVATDELTRHYIGYVVGRIRRPELGLP